MANNQHHKVFLTFLTWIILSGIFGVQTQLEKANAADKVELKATDLERVNPGDSAPDFNLESIDKSLIKLSSFQNRKDVVLIFYRGYW